jgi:hypothetical protein
MPSTPPAHQKAEAARSSAMHIQAAKLHIAKAAETGLQETRRKSQRPRSSLAT